MSNKSRPPDMPAVARLVRLHLRSNLRGRTRLTYFLARKLKSLQQVPVVIPGYDPVYIDLRLFNAHVILKNSPYAGFFREFDEVMVMQRMVRRGDVVFDVGANVGLHTVLLSRLVGPEGVVHVFEPNPELLPALTKTVSGLDNATLHPVALADREAEANLYVPSDDTMASLADWTVGRDVGESHAVQCAQRRMDDVVASGTVAHPDFIKCDVEGAELLVFQGGRRTLDRADAPVILFETNRNPAEGFGLAVAEAKDFLTSLEHPRYQFFEVQEGCVLKPIRKVNPGYSNVLAVPEAKIGLWPELASSGSIELKAEAAERRFAE